MKRKVVVCLLSVCKLLSMIRAKEDMNKNWDGGEAKNGKKGWADYYKRKFNAV